MLACGLPWNAHTRAHTTQTYADITHTQGVLDEDTMHFVYSPVRVSRLLLSTDCCQRFPDMKSRRIVLRGCGKHSRGPPNSRDPGGPHVH